jgi:eukaryotic-like serine/threonine-protein kinase
MLHDLTRIRTLTDRLCEELQGIWAKGERVFVEEYFQSYPELGLDDDCSFDLIYTEFLARESCGETPDPDEFKKRFPQFTTLFNQRMELHQAMGPVLTGFGWSDGTDRIQPLRR